MRRIQFYLEDDLWETLHLQARSQSKSISHLIRQAVRDRHLRQLNKRRDAMQAFVGIRKDRSDLPGTTEYVRSLRRGRRLNGDRG